MKPRGGNRNSRKRVSQVQVEQWLVHKVHACTGHHWFKCLCLSLWITPLPCRFELKQGIRRCYYCPCSGFVWKTGWNAANFIQFKQNHTAVAAKQSWSERFQINTLMQLTSNQAELNVFFYLPQDKNKQTDRQTEQESSSCMRGPGHCWGIRSAYSEVLPFVL